MHKYRALAVLFYCSSIFAQSGTGLTSVVDVGQALSVQCPASVGDGISDDSTAFQCHADYLSSAVNGYKGGRLHIPAGIFYLSRTFVVPENLMVQGVGDGSVLRQKHSLLQPLVKLQRHSQLKNVKLIQEQPAPTAGWSPYMDYDFQLQVAGDAVNVEDIVILNPTKGILVRSDRFPNDDGAIGQVYIRNVRGQPLYQGIYMDGILDICRINDIHFWPFWSLDQNVTNWTASNGYGILSFRNDNPFMSELFTFGYFVGMQFGVTPTPLPPGNQGNVVGFTSRARISGYDCDGCTTGVLISGNGTNGIEIDKVQILSRGPYSYSPITINASHVSASISKLDTTLSTVNAVRIDGDYNSILISDSLIRTWNVNGLGFPAFEIASGPNSVLQISNTLYGDGHGALVSRAIQGTVVINGVTHAPGVVQ
ncbi:hypothetical protein [Dokdonella soli]|uniref:Pectate lyase superfamily protein domain-containing protein n=1 Tax=Dokdonella soli TaxID=529810 RepID=A0ABN1IJ83_9GAMM